AGPVLGNGQPRRRLPAAFPQALGARYRFRLGRALEWSEPGDVPAALALVVAEPIQIEDERRRRIRAHHNAQGISRPNTRVRAVTLDPGAAILGLGIDAGVGE